MADSCGEKRARFVGGGFEVVRWPLRHTSLLHAASRFGGSAGKPQPGIPPFTPSQTIRPERSIPINSRSGGCREIESNTPYLGLPVLKTPKHT